MWPHPIPICSGNGQTYPNRKNLGLALDVILYLVFHMSVKGWERYI